MNKERLFPEFPEVSTKEWEEVIMADLKGGDYEKKLVWKTIEGFDVRPYYRAEDLKNLDLRPSTKTDNNWDIRQDIYEEDLTTANAIALEGLKRGVNSIGLNATKVVKVEDLQVLLSGIDLTQVKINFLEARSYSELIDLFIYFLKKESIDMSKVRGSLNFDPFGYALINGEFCTDLNSVYEKGAYILKVIRENIPNFDAINVGGNIFNNAGASIVQELAYTISAANEYLYNLNQKGLEIHSIGYRMMFSFATGSNYFMEIAKIRAARMLWRKIIEQYNPKCNSAYDLFISTESSYYNKTIYDPYVNMLRTTTETMSAAIAGADSISVYPFDVAFSENNSFSTRIANNQQILLKEESYLDKIVDPSAGSYYIETLTDSIAKHAWDMFKEIEAKGGFVAAIQSGFIQDEIEKTHAKRATDAAMRKTVILGTNQYPNLNERMADKVQPECCEKADKNDIKPLTCNRLSKDFELLRLEVEKSGKAPKVFLLTFGNLAFRKARAGFATNFFGVAGYEIIDNLGFSTPEEGIKAALDAKADIVVLCSSDEEYSEWVPNVTAGLKGKVNHIIVAGYPTEQVENFKAQGVTDFIHVRSNCLESLKKYNKEILG